MSSSKVHILVGKVLGSLPMLLKYDWFQRECISLNSV